MYVGVVPKVHADVTPHEMPACITPIEYTLVSLHNKVYVGVTLRMHADITPYKMHACIILTECTLKSLHNKVHVGITPRTHADVTPHKNAFTRMSSGMDVCYLEVVSDMIN